MKNIKIPKHVANMTSEQAFVYGLLSQTEFLTIEERNEAVQSPVRTEAVLPTTWERSNGEKVNIVDMNERHLTHAYNQLVRERKHTSLLGSAIQNEITKREI